MDLENVTYGDDDLTRNMDSENNFNKNSSQNTHSVDVQKSGKEYESHDNYDVLYENLDYGNEYGQEDETYAGEDDYYDNDDNQVSQESSFKFEKGSGDIAYSNVIDSAHKTGKDVKDITFVNSHMQEIVDIKNQIKELEDRLYDKSPESEEKFKLDEANEYELDVKLWRDVSKKKVSPKTRTVELKRSSLSKLDAKKHFKNRNEGSILFKRKTNKIPLSSERIEDRIVSSTLGKEYKKKRGKRTDFGEEEEMGGQSYPGFRHASQKNLSESIKLRSEKKTKSDEIVVDDCMDVKSHEIESIPQAVISSLRKILQMSANTPEEKYKVLDARDKLYKIMREKDSNTKLGALVGTCPDMCPEKERLQREFQYQVSIFEMVNYPKNTSLNHNLAVKQYCRSSADQEEPLPHELRPVPVLSMTMNYLLHKVVDHCELSDDNLEEWYMFMWDRTRALRKELTQQGACNLDTVKLVEQCARFHIHCAERLVDQDSSIYDDKINTENLTKCLQTLKYMYRDLANENIYCPNESEFVCYSLLLNLNNTSVFTELSDMSERLMSSEPVRFALDVMIAWETRNYVRFFSLVNKTTYLNCCILRRYFNEMRMYATKTMIRSYCTKYHSPQISIYRFIDNLSFEGVEDCLSFLSNCNFDFHKNADEIFVNFNRLSFRNPESPIPSGRASIIIGQKKKWPLSVVMAGGELPAKSYEDHTPQNSFEPSGELKSDALLCKNLIDFASSPSVSFVPPQPPAIQTAKSKMFEWKEEPLKHEKQSCGQIFSSVFGKGPKFAQEDKDEGSTNKTKFEFGKNANQLPLFSKTEENKTNIFGPCATTSACSQNTTSSIFHTNIVGDASKASNPFATVGNSIFSGNTNILKSNEPLFKINQNNSNIPTSAATSTFLFKNSTVSTETGFRFKLPTPPTLGEGKIEHKETEQKSVENQGEKNVKFEVMHKEKEQQEQEEKFRESLLEAMKLKQEERRKEIERKEAEERQKREREELEEKNRLAELEKQERIRKAELLKLEELAKIEEARKKFDADYKLKIDMAMASLREKYLQWKARQFFNRWRLNTWIAIERRKMEKYFKESQANYPLVCTDDQLDGNPYGLVIPNVLLLRKYRMPGTENWPLKITERICAKEFSTVNIPELIVKPLEARAKSLSNKADPFLWKLVLSVPDESECTDWKVIETFIELNFVDNYSLRFDRQEGPLYYNEGCRANFRYKVSIRKVRGDNLYEGTKVNSNAATGSSALIFVLSEDCDLTVAKKRFSNFLISRPPLPKIPVTVFELGDKHSMLEIRSILDIEKWSRSHVSEFHYENSIGSSKDELKSQFGKCLTMAAEKSSPVTVLRISKLSEFYSSDWFESVWRRMETSFSNYKVIIKDPTFLIDCYNSCVDQLEKIFLNSENDSYTLIGDEFCNGGLVRPKMCPSYEKKLRESLEHLKLPHWPKEIPKSCNQLKYRIHQYCKKVAHEDKEKVKALKWILYGTIRRSLLWKGLDIYCNEDIESILMNFPWIQFFQVLSRFIVQELIKKLRSEKEPNVLYRLDILQQFSYETSLISKFLKKSAKTKKRSMFEDMECVPCLEHDSVVYAYSAALERENNKRKREENVVEESVDDIFRLAERKRQQLDEQTENLNRDEISELKTNFQNIDDRLDEIKRRFDENEKILKALETS